MINSKIGLFDLDQTLADYEGAMRRDLDRIKSPEEPSYLDSTLNLWKAERGSFLSNRMELIKRLPGWWENLARNQLGWDIYDIAERIGFDITILTKGPRSKPQAWAEKVKWVDKELGNNVPIDIVSLNKDNRYGLFLADDHIDYARGWLKNRPRGLAILPAANHNTDAEKELGKNAIRYDGTNKLEVQNALFKAYYRKTGQCWREIDLTKIDIQPQHRQAIEKQEIIS